ncbi:lipopolysaccharide transport periplasmic protein LptA [Ferrimonas sp. SCSIO 43195]|uniref:lipopolysaccharide transport periplasmic protein LptA n=1 Tax=Ferrimonas sp. SCSIO 43195 TaxID=2822844 RepID=UPI002076268B|nr:lipopolysaccharide transport periplasmic protein LptA [Ferrimonas sp. SCSIO 43195]USD37245.1 lipopolysaccharide transport periplasmic protein LptA [Ferrimonas sp. SCSIO 43195]
MKPIKLLLTALLVVASTSSLALDSDTREKVEIKADKSNADLPNGTIVYSGRVRISQGTLLINADELRVEATDNKDVKVLVATGTPATYQQMMENGKLAEAEAGEIRYSLQDRILTLSHNAEMRQSGSLVKGDTIQYDLNQQKLLAESSGDEQITTIFLPADADLKPDPKPEPSPQQQPTDPKQGEQQP